MSKVLNPDELKKLLEIAGSGVKDPNEAAAASKEYSYYDIKRFIEYYQYIPKKPNGKAFKILATVFFDYYKKYKKHVVMEDSYPPFPVFCKYLREFGFDFKQHQFWQFGGKLSVLLNDDTSVRNLDNSVSYAYLIENLSVDEKVKLRERYEKTKKRRKAAAQR